MTKKPKTLVITGGSRGVGAEIARLFYRNGYFVVIGARTENPIASKLGSNARFQVTDVRYEKDHLRLIETALKFTGSIEVYINCAGFSQWRSVNEVDEDFWNDMIDTNLKGVFWGCKTSAQHLKEGGCIINISSLAGKRGSSNNSVYCASKFGVNGITLALAKELGPRKIRVNAVCPVYVETEGLLSALSDGDSPAGGKDINAYLQKFASDNAALRRLPTANEVAQVCLFLASSKAEAVTGQCINVDCGVLSQ